MVRSELLSLVILPLMLAEELMLKIHLKLAKSLSGISKKIRITKAICELVMM